MGTVRKSITLTDTQDAWIKAQVEAGHYTSESEYIRDLIRREQECGAETEAIRAALIEGEASGEAMSFDVAAFKQRMLADLGCRLFPDHKG
ncbi:MAG TPA: type II toxin-antitoxin system ParD family antitoxin [Duganella sp.]|uniref:type II toxin-antitoxin system ParD family antitoxin n=1 Tax=Duganella sp. TaxID=1904440 RepID=UPI002ED52015